MKLQLRYFITFFFVINLSFAQEQELIDVTEQTIKIKGLSEEELYFGFATGDKMIFSFQEIDGKEIKEIEIIEFPENSKFSDYKTAQIEKKVISVFKQSIFKFRFKNTAITGRICKIKIQRIPASEDTKNFNSTVTWKNKQETTYKTFTKDVIVGYEDVYTQKTKRALVKTELSEDMFLDKSERIHSINNLDYKNLKYIQVNLPQNEISLYKTKKVISWAYWIGVGKEASEAWGKNVRTLKNFASGAVTIFGGGPLTGIAIGAVSDLAMPTMGEDVAYWFIPDQYNAQLFVSRQTFMQFDKGKGIAAFGKNTGRTQGTFYIGLLNDNQFQGIDVNLKVSVIWETNYYEDRTFTEKSSVPKYETKVFSEPIIKTYKVPVTGQR